MSNGNLSDQLIAHSVTKDEVAQQKPYDGLVTVRLGLWGGYGGTSTVMQQFPDLDANWSMQRDRLLVSTVGLESHWAQACGLATMTFLTRSWDVDGEVPLLQLERNRKRIRGVDYIGSFSQMFTDYILRDAGAFLEIVRPTSAPTGVIGLRYLNAARCMPTGYDPEPVVYWDRLGHPHTLKDYQVMRFTDMIDGASPFKVGVCAAHRAYNDIRLYAAMQRYRLEKVTGARPLSVHFLSGVSPNQVKGALADHETQMAADNLVAYGGVVIVPFIQKEGITDVEIPISSLPDNFSNKEEVQMVSISYGNALPLITYLDIMPMTGQRAGSGAQSQVIDDSKANKEAILRDITLKFNDQELYKIVTHGVTFSFVKNDLADKKREADIINVFATAAAHLVKDCGFAQPLVLKWLVDNDVLPADDNPKEQFGQLDASSNESGNATKAPYAGIVNEKPQVSGDPTTALNTKTKGTLSDTQLQRLGNELRTIYRSNHEVAPERIRSLVDSYLVGTKETNMSNSSEVVPAGDSGDGAHTTNFILPPFTIPQPIMQVVLPPISITQPAPASHVIQVAPSPAPNVTVRVPAQSAPQVTVNVPQAPAPVVQNTVNVPPPAPIPQTEELVVKRGENGLIQSIVKKIRR